MMENIIKILKYKKTQKGRLKEQEQKHYSQTMKLYLKQYGLLQNYMKEVQKGDQYLDDIIEQFEHQEFREGDFLYKQSDFMSDNNYIYFVMQGRVALLEMKSQQTVKQQQKQYQELQKLRKQLAQLGRNQDYQSTKRFLDQIMIIENELQVKQHEEIYEICCKNLNLQEYFYADWKQRQCKFIKREELTTQEVIGESDIFANRRPNTCFVVSKTLHTLKIDIKLFHEKFFSRIFQIQFLSNVLKEQLHLLDQNSIQIQKIAEQFVLQQYSNNIFLFKEEPKGIYVLLYGDVAQMNGDKELQVLSEGEIFGIEDMFSDRRRCSYIVRNEEKAKVYFLKKDLIIDNKQLIESIMKVSAQKMQQQSNISSIGNTEPGTRKKEQYFDRRFKITEDKMGPNQNSNNSLGINKIHQRQKHLHHQMESADDIINNSKKILEKQQQPFIKTFQEQKYLQQILNQQKKINARIPSLFPNSNLDESKQQLSQQFMQQQSQILFQQQNLRQTQKQPGSCNSLDQYWNNANNLNNNNNQNNFRNTMSKQQSLNQNENSTQTQFKGSGNLIESLKIYFNNKRSTSNLNDFDANNNTPQLIVQTPYITQSQAFTTQTANSDEKRNLMKWYPRNSLKKIDNSSALTQNSQSVQTCTFNFADELKGRKNSLSKNLQVIHSQNHSEPKQFSKRQLPQLEQYLKIMKEQNGNSEKLNYLIGDDNFTNKQNLHKESIESYTNGMLSADDLEKFQFNQPDNHFMKNQSAFYSTLRNDSIVLGLSDNHKKSTSVEKNNKKRSSSNGRNKNKITITSFINNQSKSAKRIDTLQQSPTESPQKDVQDIQCCNEEQALPTRRYQNDFFNQEKLNNNGELETQGTQIGLNNEKKSVQSLNKINRMSYLQNIFPDRRDSVNSQNISTTTNEITTKNSENSSPMNSIVSNGNLIKKNNQLILRSKFQKDGNPFHSSTLNQQIRELNTNSNKLFQGNPLQRSEVVMDKDNRATATSREKNNNESPKINQYTNVSTKKNSISELNEKLVLELQKKITEYSDKSFLQSLNQLKEQKKQISNAISSDIIPENKSIMKTLQKNTLNLIAQLNNQQFNEQSQEAPKNTREEALKATENNAVLFENKILNDLISKNTKTQ